MVFKKQIYLFLMVLLFVAGCGSNGDGAEPRTIDPTLDICPTCKMSIVDLHFAAQVIDNLGEPVSFDDIGCMVLYLKRLGEQWEQSTRAVYVKDFHSMEWLPAREAHYVHGGVNTPMSFGIVAFAAAEEAGLFAGRTGGKVLAWDEVLTVRLTVGLDSGPGKVESSGEQQAVDNETDK